MRRGGPRQMAFAMGAVRRGNIWLGRVVWGSNRIGLASGSRVSAVSGAMETLPEMMIPRSRDLQGIVE